MKESHCGELPEAMLDPLVLAQRARDARMAERMEAAGAERGAVLITGKGHARNGPRRPGARREGRAGEEGRLGRVRRGDRRTSSTPPPIATRARRARPVRLRRLHARRPARRSVRGDARPHGEAAREDARPPGESRAGAREAGRALMLPPPLRIATAPVSLPPLTLSPH